MLNDNLLYYSANTFLAHFINERYYKGNHFVWCAPVFNPLKLNALDPLRNIPVSSSPFHIYHRLSEDIETLDCHSEKIRTTLIGLKKGASINKSKGVITDVEYDTIISIVDNANNKQLRPLLYVIPKALVEHKIVVVDVKNAANPLGVEYQIPDLKTGEFEILEISKN